MPESSSPRLAPEAVRPPGRSTGSQPWPRAARWHGPVFAVFLVWLTAAALLLITRVQLPAGWNWVEGVVYVLAAASALCSLARRLPVQNVIACGLVVGSLAAVLVSMGAKTGLGFGEVSYSDALGPKVLGLMAWPVPWLWIAWVLSSRGVARLVLRPWRRQRYYGYGLLGVTALLVVLQDLMLEPFAVAGRGYWSWHSPGLWGDWYGVPWTAFVGALLMAALIGAFASPWFIMKRPVSQLLDYHPLIMWLGLALLFTVGSLAAQLWWAAGVGLVVSGAVGVLAWYFGRRFTRPTPPPVGALSE